VHENVLVEGRLENEQGEVVAKVRATWKLEVFDA
jgi:hypothetical protein